MRYNLENYKSTLVNKGLLSTNMYFYIILSILAFSLPHKSLQFTQNYISLMKELGMNNPFIIGNFNIKEAHQVFKQLNEDSQFVGFLTEIQNISYTGYSGILVNLPYKELKSSITKSWIILKYISYKIIFR